MAVRDRPSFLTVREFLDPTGLTCLPAYGKYAIVYEEK